MSTKIGVYVCHCGTNISGKVNVEEVTEFAKNSARMWSIAREYKFMCSDPGQILIEDDIKNLGLDRIVVASCSPLMHEPTFRGACERANVNRYLFQMANIREHCSWVTVDPNAATEKAKALLAGAVAKAGNLQSLPHKTVPVNPAALVVGAGIAGIQAALDIADSGRTVYLVEKQPSIGGHMATVRQDLSHAGLRRLHSDAQNGPGRKASEYQADALQRSGKGRRICRQLPV